MSYTINKYNGDTITVVADGTIDATLDIKLIGKNYAGYGEILNENFTFLLENFAGTAEPPRKIKGQIWFDSANSKIKFYDGSKFRTATGAEVASSAPSGLTPGDFWFNTATNQLFAWSATGAAGNIPGFVLVGPQGIAGEGITEMKSVNVPDNQLPIPGQHPIIEAVVNGTTIFTISPDADFTLSSTILSSNPELIGFTQTNGVRQGITLYGVDSNGATSAYKINGTATNALKLNGIDGTNYVNKNTPVFAGAAQFTDNGYSVGTLLSVFNDNSVPTIRNNSNATIKFQTFQGVQKTPLQLVGNNLYPGSDLVSDIGSLTAGAGNTPLRWNNIYANYYYGTAQKADGLTVNSIVFSGSTSAVASTIAARDGSGNLSAVLFQGTASSAQYADLAEKYLADSNYPVGTVVAVGGEKEVTAVVLGNIAIGVVSDKPAYLMNKDLVGGTAIALKGRVPVQVVGPVIKGDYLIGTDLGCATSTADLTNRAIFAISLETSNHDGVKLVECVIL
jgi:hypothetical protein